jgi:iron complex transport system substrate-binding protein
MSNRQRIVSFLPSATEMVYALGLEDQLAAVTHECDYPAEARSKPVIVGNVLPIESMNQSEIDEAVAERIRNGLSLYQIDEDLFRKLAPDLILTQNLCQVCAPSGNEVSQVLGLLAKRPEILWMSPKSVAEIFANLNDLGVATGRASEAERLILTAREKLQRIVAATREINPRPRVFCMEWLDPVYCSGHWVPEMVEMAGGIDRLGQPQADSIRISWDDVVALAPEVFIVTPCGFNLEQVIKQAANLANYPGWFDLPAVREGRVYAVDANSYFARPSPRAVVEGTELLAHLIHPELFAWNGPGAAYARCCPA